MNIHIMAMRMDLFELLTALDMLRDRGEGHKLGAEGACSMCLNNGGGDGLVGAPCHDGGHGE